MKNKSILTPALRNHDLLATLMLVSILHSQPSAFAQNTNVTYQGRVRSGGSDFTGTGQFKFALVTSLDANAPATATAVTSGGFLTIINVTSGGSGYVTAPAVTISGGGGSGATATASVSGGALISVTVNNPGSGYGSPPTVTIAAPPENLSYTTYWSNDGASIAGSEPAAAVSVPVGNGLFTVRLGDGAQANMAPLGTGLFAQPNLQLRLWFNDGVNGFAVLHPAQRLTAAPYAMVAGSASNLLGTVGTANLGGTYGNAVTFNNAANSFSGNGGGLTNVNAVTLGGLNSSNFWRMTGNAGATPGTQFLGTTDTNALEFKVNNQRALRIGYATDGTYGYSPNIVGGFFGNVISNGFVGETIGGGGFSTSPNRAGNHFATVVGGAGNTANGIASTAMGGITTASGNFSTAMGNSTTASGERSTAMGSSAKALHDGSFVWADWSGLDFASTAANQFCIRASGGVQLSGDTSISFGTATRQMLNFYGLGFGVGVQTGTLYARSNTRFSWFVGGVHSDLQNNAGGGAVAMTLTTAGLTVNGVVVSSSDRNVKAGFSVVDPQTILEKVAALPIQRWHFTNDVSTPHIGPVAQDFYAAFNVGSDDKQIATVDADGVALAAIQGLNQKMEEKEARVTALEKELAELKQLVVQLSTRGN